MKNLFTAPDIIDLLREKKFSLHLVLFMLLSGTILVFALIGAYHLTKNYFVKHESTTTELTPTEENTLPTLESRLAELGGSGEAGPYDVGEAVRRVEELQGSSERETEVNTKTIEDRIKELQ